MPILNYTTKIDSYKTISEIQQSLAKNGAFKITIDNDQKGNPIGITFCIVFQNAPVAFALPCNFSGVRRSMSNNKKVPRSMCTDEQALRVGWRILKDWIEAQMAIVQAELSTLAEVFLPYAVMKTGNTVYQHFLSNDQLLLTN